MALARPRATRNPRAPTMTMAATIFCLRLPRERRRRGPARSRAKSEDDGGEPCQFGAGLSAPALTVERCRSVTTGPERGLSSISLFPLARAARRGGRGRPPLSSFSPSVPATAAATARVATSARRRRASMAPQDSQAATT